MTLAYTQFDGGGNFRGAILSGMDLQRFGELFANAMLYPRLTFAVWIADGTIMYRYPGPEKRADKRLPETEITRAVRARQAETVVIEAKVPTGAPSSSTAGACGQKASPARARRFIFRCRRHGARGG